MSIHLGGKQNWIPITQHIQELITGKLNTYTGRGKSLKIVTKKRAVFAPWKKSFLIKTQKTLVIRERKYDHLFITDTPLRKWEDKVANSICKLKQKRTSRQNQEQLLQTKEKIRTQLKTAQNKVFNNCLINTRDTVLLQDSSRRQEGGKCTGNPLPHKLQKRKDLTTGISSTSERKCDCHSVWKDLQLKSLPFPLQNPLQNACASEHTHTHVHTHIHKHTLAYMNIFKAAF